MEPVKFAISADHDSTVRILCPGTVCAIDDPVFRRDVNDHINSNIFIVLRCNCHRHSHLFVNIVFRQFGQRKLHKAGRIYSNISGHNSVVIGICVKCIASCARYKVR